jgi:hypothetical protein
MKKLVLLQLFCLCSMNCIFSQSLNWQWAKVPTAVNYYESEGWAAAVDASNNLFATGYFSGVPFLIFGRDTVYNIGNVNNTNNYLVKYTAEGNTLWAKGASTSGIAIANVDGMAVATDKNENVFIAGFYFGDSVSFGSFMLPNSPTNTERIFLAKYDSAGHVLWATSPNGTFDNDLSIGIATDIDGGLFITGHYGGDSLQLGATTLFHTSLTSNWDVYLAKYDAAGNVLWARGSRSPTLTNVPEYQESAAAVVSDASGNVYIAGTFFNDSITFGGITLLPGDSNYHSYLVKYDSVGNQQWAKIPKSGHVFVSGMAIYMNRDVYITGYFGDSISSFDEIFYVTKLDSSGNTLWTRNVTGCIYSGGYSVVTDSNGNVFVSGFFEWDSLTIGGIHSVLEVGGPDPMFIFSFDSSGNILCTTLLPSGGDDQSGIAVGNNGVGYVTGDFYSDSLALGNINLIGNGGEITFTAAFYCPNCLTSDYLNYTLSSNILCPGDSALITFNNNSAASILPNSSVSWLDSTQAILKPDTTTTYTVSGYALCGAHVTQFLTITVVNERVSITSNKTIICSTDSAQICAPAGYTTYLWNSGQTTTCIYTRAAGDYYVTVTENGGCSATSNHLGIDVYPSVPVSVSVLGDTLISGNANSYQWMLNGSNIIGATSYLYVALNPGAYTLQVTDSNGCTEISTPIVVGRIGEVDGSKISIYPNPSNGKWILSGDNSLLKAEIEVFDAAGRLIYSRFVENLQSVIDISGVAKGVYELRVKGDGFSAIRKLVKI